MTLHEAIKAMADEIASVLSNNKPSIYLYGSVVLDDFKLGWSDIDILVLTEFEITEEQASKLVSLRQNMLEKYPDNPYFRLFEGGMLSLDALLNNTKERTVYWGTGGQRIIDSYKVDSFALAELLDSGVLLHGNDIRGKMVYPSYAQMRNDIAWHVQGARKHGAVVGWLLDIARGIYTLRTGKVIAKTAAGEWALENNLCPDADAMQKAVQCRKEPHLMQEKSIDNAIIQRFADVIDAEFANTAERFAGKAERRHIAYGGRKTTRGNDMKHLGTVTLETERLILRRFESSDAEAMFNNWASDAEVTKFLTWPAHSDVSVSKAVIGSWIPLYNNLNHYSWAIVLKEISQPIGSIAVVDQRDDIRMVHIGYCIGRKWWRQGYASESLAELIRFFFEDVGVNRIESRHDPRNPNSGKVMQKCGLK